MSQVVNRASQGLEAAKNIPRLYRRTNKEVWDTAQFIFIVSFTEETSQLTIHVSFLLDCHVNSQFISNVRFFIVSRSLMLRQTQPLQNNTPLHVCKVFIHLVNTESRLEENMHT